MDFQKCFMHAVKANRMAAITSDPAFLIPNLYHYTKQEEAPELLRLLGGGALHTDYPLSFSFSPMDCRMLLFTEDGGGRVATSGGAVTVTDNQILFFDCNQPFSMQSILLPWHFKLFFIDGKYLDIFRELAGALRFPCMPVPEVSSIHSSFYSLLSVSGQPSVRELLTMHKDLTDILCSLAVSLCPRPERALDGMPGYLVEMRDFIENHYMENFSLQHYENLFRINKYRLCREFSRTFGVPPLRCLTDKRLSKAKEMLLTTDWTVHEISSKVGYENVNHFINLFKKETGATPRVFRQKAQGHQSVLHSSLQ